MNKFSQIFSSLFFIGYIKWIPGTIGSLISLIIITILNDFINKNLFIFLFVVLLILSIIFIEKYSKYIKKYDAKEIIIDEFLGIYLIIIATNDFNYFFNDYIKFLLIFIFFRFFDIIKPFPAKWVDKNIKNAYICSTRQANLNSL